MILSSEYSRRIYDNLSKNMGLCVKTSVFYFFCLEYSDKKTKKKLKNTQNNIKKTQIIKITSGIFQTKIAFFIVYVRNITQK